MIFVSQHLLAAGTIQENLCHSIVNHNQLIFRIVAFRFLSILHSIFISKGQGHGKAWSLYLNTAFLLEPSGVTCCRQWLTTILASSYRVPHLPSHDLHSQGPSSCEDVIFAPQHWLAAGTMWENLCNLMENHNQLIFWLVAFGFLSILHSIFISEGQGHDKTWSLYLNTALLLEPSGVTCRR